MWHAADALLQLVDAHLARYPLMELRDVYKLLYQGVLGPEHLLAAPGAFAARLRLEYEAVPAAAVESLYESVRPDGRLLRVNLRSFKARGGDLDRLVSVCQEATTEHWGTSDDLRAAWATIAGVYRTGCQPRLAAEAAAFSAWLDAHSYPAVHHSARYREAYRPAYRLVNRAACIVLFGDPSRLAQAIVTTPDKNRGYPMTDSTSLKTILQQRQQLQEIARGYRIAQVLLTCVELGVFEVIAAGAATKAEITAAITCDARGTGLLLNSAASLGLLEKHDGRFANAPLAETCLTRGGAGYMVGSLRLERAFYRRWERLADAVCTGQRPEEDRRGEQTGDWVRNFVYGLYDMARPVAPFIAEGLALPEDRPLRVIDVGGCHAAYSLALARRHPFLTATVFELPAVVPVAREIIAQAGLADRVAVQEGDFQRQELGSGYDVALVFGVLNGEPPAGRPALIRKVYDCLTPGGRIVLRDFVLDDDRAGPPEAALFALQMLLATEAGGLDTRADWARWLAAAGFTPPQTIALPDWVGGTLTVAEKPAK